MLRHVVLFRLIEDVPEGTLQSLKDGLSHLADSIAEISSYSFGLDLGLREGNFALGIVADFEDEKAFNRYVEHPQHQAFIADELRPVLAERVALQFEF